MSRTVPDSLVDLSVYQHRIANGEDSSRLLTVCSSPLGVASYVTGGDDEVTVDSVRLEHGQVVTKTVSDRFGTVIAVLGGPAVVEVALHATEVQRETYRATVAEVDHENRDMALAAMQQAAVGIVQELGVTLEEHSEEETPA